MHYGVSSEVANEKLPEIKLSMIEFTKEHANEIGEGLLVLPGVASLLQALSSKDNVLIGLVFVFLYDVGPRELGTYTSVIHLVGLRKKD
ncbi:hypothetical protein AMTR_s00049p00054350 [Amborella trichopoda]|uniref:Uncharacterized protein n=1 Tax=Amborella trichopoda TaxID=13333 RepID=W1PZK1_AMBTC|nr:hypothetical protein AMTR_s00049p00054350 [Amborella trichopoda]